MHITVEPRDDDAAILHLRGEFDTYYVPALQSEIEALLKAGTNRVVLDLRLVKFINSTALGAIIKVSKLLAAKGGKLTIARPSKFCRDIIEKVGLDRVVPVHETEEAALSSMAQPGRAAQPLGEEQVFEEDQSSVLFSPVDGKRVEHFVSKGDGPVNPLHGHDFGGRWSGVGRMSGLDEEGLSFTWSGGKTDLEPFAMAQLLALGTEWRLKFRLPLLKKGYSEAVATVSEVEERAEGVKVRASFSEIDEETRASIRQYAKDMSFLKDELRKATDR